MEIPEVRLMMDSDGVVPLYAVIKGPHGWYGAPGLRRGRFLTDDDVKDAIPLQPGPAVLVEIGFDHDSARAFADGQAEAFADGRYDVKINGKRAAFNVPVMTAGTYVVSAAVQKAGEPIMVRAVRKPATVIPLKAPGLSVVRDDG